MGLADIIRNGVAIAKRTTADLQVPVTYYAWTGVDGYNKPTFAAAQELMAIVDFRQRRRRLADGTEIVQTATVTFVQPLTANGASGRREPIDPRDKIVLPNGHVGPILEVSGPVDPATSLPYLVDVMLG